MCMNVLIHNLIGDRARLVIQLIIWSYAVGPSNDYPCFQRHENVELAPQTF